MRLHRIALGAVVAATLALTGCGATKDQATGDSSAGAGGAAKPASGLQYMVPNAPGGGYDKAAMRAQVPVVPVCVVGAEEAAPVFAQLRLPSGA